MVRMLRRGAEGEIGLPGLSAYPHELLWRLKMPYVSDAQRRYAHTKTARNKGWKASSVKEFDQASKGLKLPERVSKKQRAVGKKLKSAMG